MSTSVLATKLHVPVSRQRSVDRRRLLERLERGRQQGARLTLVLAPPGFGKSTLLTDWVTGLPTSESKVKVGWLSLDAGDNDLPRFLSHLVAALRGPGSVSDVEVIPATASTSAQLVTTELINRLAQEAAPTVLVLDDYHLIESQEVHDAVAFLVSHMPEQLHVALASRSDPPIPTARLRGRGQLTELRAADLRFTNDEAGDFLNQVMGLHLEDADVAALDERTEGWIAGLQLAGLSMRDRDDSSAFIASFAGSNRFVLDYLVEEVLSRQPQALTEFLMSTSILDRLSPSLCAAVTGRNDAGTMLEELERRNLFLLPLDDRREWYRYHHLFADVLRSHLLQSEPHQVRQLHRKASVWLEEHRQPEQAVQHAVAGEDYAGAARLIEEALPTVRRNRQDAMMLGWLRVLPDEVIRAHPVLNAHYAWSMLVAGDLDEAERRLAEAQRASEQDAVAPPGSERRALPMTLALYRASLAQARGDIDATMAHARDALRLSPPDDDFARGGAAGFLGLAAWSKGDIDTALETFGQAVSSLHSAGNIADELGSTVPLAEMWGVKGRPKEARRLYERALGIAAAAGPTAALPTADLHVGLGDVLRELGDLTGAMEHLRIASSQGETASLAENRYRWHAVDARVRAAVGDLDGACGSIEEAQRRYRRGFFPEVRPIAAARARLLISAGDLAGAAGWVSARGIGATDPVNYLLEFEHLTLARLLIAQYRAEPHPEDLGQALDLLGRLGAAAQAAGRDGTVMEVEVLTALAHDAAGNVRGALEVLTEVLLNAHERGHVGVFLDEGAPIIRLLQRAAQGEASREAAKQLLAVASAAEAGLLPARSAPNLGGVLLSERELDVLRLLRSELSGPEMARELYVSLNTLRTHTKRIFTKLDVNSRPAAIRRAEELGLI